MVHYNYSEYSKEKIELFEKIMREKSVVDESGCIIWKCKDLRFRVGVEKYMSMRIAYMLSTKQDVPQDKIIKTCEKNKNCIYEKHIILTTFSKLKTKSEEEQIEYIKNELCKIDKNKCWIFQRNLDEYGYGKIKYKKQSYSAHRLMYILKYGEIKEGLVIRHGQNCDTSCCNPDHLSMGTHKDNAQDKLRDNTLLLGERNPRSKITKELAQKIKLAKFNKDDSRYKTAKDIAKHFDISLAIVKSIWYKGSWSHLKGNENINYGEKQIRDTAQEITINS